jgi:ABC-type polysaccharide/polyol phosphate transport system ATPase subunit
MVYGVRDIAMNMFGLRTNSSSLRKGEFWALNNLSFQVKEGETLGIIGPNGSGKSTLLKLINGIFMPDTGMLEILGSVGALIEVGAGFHPLLSGRENVYVNGAILGMSKREIDERFDEIVDFADIGDFIDAPVKHYSSGMYVRLGFSIAVHSAPDILLVDEVLAVGDINFQVKCFRKIAEFKEQGKTIIMVTHDMTAIQRHTDRVLLLNRGRLEADDTPENIVGKYLSLMSGSSDSSSSEKGSIVENLKDDICYKKSGYNINEFRYGNGAARIVDYNLLDKEERPIDCIISGEPFIFKLKVKFLNHVSDHIHGLRITGEGGVEIINDNTLHYKDLTVKPQNNGDILWVKHTVTLSLSPGIYTFSVGVATTSKGEVIAVDRRYDIARFRVKAGGSGDVKYNLEPGITLLYNEDE